MFADLQRSIVSYLKSKELVIDNDIHVWTNADGDLEAMIQSQLNAINPLAIIVLDIAPQTVGDVYGFLQMGVDVHLRVLENVVLNSTDVHAIDLTLPLLQWLHSWAPQDIDGFNGCLMAVTEDPVLDEAVEPGIVQKLFRFTTVAGAEVDHSIQIEP